ncbi:MAG: cobalt-precorrin-5B (C(1))-methyltransferase CbiD [Roseburia hominis]|nr:cobalt-precorrin-5B (C(1))-methyltransferase CbiD [Roseburia hominis]MCI7521940.1 cobalt-precorrin-5B (C(1))-methyltransferase CbiD [Roseburia hominis]MDD6241511.1 cobalt-precorrin-5B (C(1))-methyltransferase CbiD [Roseburia hominis]
MRYGFTTGSCAAAAAKAAAYMLLTGRRKHEITITTPKGILYHAKIEEISCTEYSVRCAVRKDGGDDPDITTGTLIFAEVSVQEKVKEQGEPRILITGGEGVGTVTRPGLDQPVGSAAINHVPREMITREVEEVCALTDYAGSLLVEISVQGGEELAQKTFNPRLGIVGGISILGTTGIVEPMSSQALLDTIHVELKQKREEGYRFAAISPGNYGLEYMKRAYGFDLDRSVKCSNFIGKTMDMVGELGFEAVLLTGHIGKLVKLSGGIMDTHSREADARMELLMAAAYRAGCAPDTLGKILDCLVTEEALSYIAKDGCLAAAMAVLMEKILFYLRKRVKENLRVECILYANGYGELARSDGAVELLEQIRQEEAHLQ